MTVRGNSPFNNHRKEKGNMNKEVDICVLEEEKA